MTTLSKFISSFSFLYFSFLNVWNIILNKHIIFIFLLFMWFLNFFTVQNIRHHFGSKILSWIVNIITLSCSLHSQPSSSIINEFCLIRQKKKEFLIGCIVSILCILLSIFRSQLLITFTTEKSCQMVLSYIINMLYSQLELVHMVPLLLFVELIFIYFGRLYNFLVFIQISDTSFI